MVWDWLQRTTDILCGNSHFHDYDGLMMYKGDIFSWAPPQYSSVVELQVTPLLS